MQSNPQRSCGSRNPRGCAYGLTSMAEEVVMQEGGGLRKGRMGSVRMSERNVTPYPSQRRMQFVGSGTPHYQEQYNPTYTPPGAQTGDL